MKMPNHAQERFLQEVFGVITIAPVSQEVQHRGLVTPQQFFEAGIAAALRLEGQFFVGKRIHRSLAGSVKIRLLLALSVFCLDHFAGLGDKGPTFIEGSVQLGADGLVLSGEGDSFTQVHYNGILGILQLGKGLGALEHGEHLQRRVGGVDDETQGGEAPGLWLRPGEYSRNRSF